MVLLFPKTKIRVFLDKLFILVKFDYYKLLLLLLFLVTLQKDIELYVVLR